MLVSLDITDARLRNISQGLLIGVNPVRTLHSSSLALCSSCPINFRLKRNNKKRIMVIRIMVAFGENLFMVDS